MPLLPMMLTRNPRLFDEGPMTEMLPGANSVAISQAIHGWPIPGIFALDARRPGLARRLFAAKGLARQVYFFVLAEVFQQRESALAAKLTPDCDPAEDALKIIADALCCLPLRELLQRAVGTVPTGLVGALRKSGKGPLAPTAYSLLLALLTEAEVPERGHVVRQVPHITSDILETIAVVHRHFLRPDWVEAIGDAKTATALNAMLDLIRDYCEPDQDALMNSITADGAKKPRDWAARWAAKAIRFPLASPLSDAAFVALSSAEAMRRAALEVGNCLGSASKINAALLGRVLYYRYVPDPCIVELVPLSDGHWEVIGLYGPHNRTVSQVTTAKILTALGEQGILSSAILTHYRRLQAASRVLECWDHDTQIRLAPDIDEDLDDLLN